CCRDIRVLCHDIQDFITKSLDVHTTKKENLDSLSYFQENQETESWSNFAISDKKPRFTSYFQENQETESWSNFAISDNFKNKENQDFKSWKYWSEKPNLVTKAYWISCTTLNEPILRPNGSQDQVLEKMAH
ncbi:hypothetical protein J1N35_018920, partial [Gossypium stocksii]